MAEVDAPDEPSDVQQPDEPQFAPRSGHIPVLDAVRAGCALYVAAYHSVDLMTRSGRKFHEPAGPIHLLMGGDLLGLLGWGHFAVIVFFVLSGFAIHVGQARHRNSVATLGFGPWLTRYAAKRALRLYPPLIGAAAITVMMGAYGASHLRHFYGRVIDHPTGAPLVLHNATWSQFGHLMFPTAGGTLFGANGALWSVGFEMWFYALYVAVALLVLFHRISLRPILLVALFCSFLLSAVDDRASGTAAWDGRLHVGMYFGTWMMGAWLAELYARGITLTNVRRWGAGGLTLVALALITSNDASQFIPDYLFAAGSTIWLGTLVLRSQRAALEPRPAASLLGRQACWSYSLYLVHMPTILFVQALMGTSVDPVSSPIPVVAALAATLTVALLLYWVLERPSVALIRKIK